MPTNRNELEANVVNSKIYLIGGRTGGQFTTVGLNEVYDIANDSWTTTKPIPYPVVSYASAVSGGKIYIMGGQDEFLHNNLDVNFTQIYDPQNDIWSFGLSLPTTVMSAAAGATTGAMAPKRIYLFGGNPNGEIGGTNITQIYDPKNNTWMYGASMPTARYLLTVAVVNDTLYAIGGSTLLTRPFIMNNEQYTPLGYGTIPLPNSSSVTKTDSFPIAVVSIMAVICGITILVYLMKRRRKTT
jgi:N-acetylneuraminic acid mutarotase